ncbi:MAG: pyruvate kinase [Bacteroidales bacterium]|nr:pyruvate kinase [Bacteroidales bacterium]MBN2757222.1 pyruvate kinase [Bacteroidales bacterium]
MLLKQTKIVATISDKRCDIPFLKELFDAGMNVVRLNTAHQSTEQSLKVIENVRKVSERIAILIDTKGPEIRTSVTETKIKLIKGNEILFKSGADFLSTEKCIYTTYNDFVKDVPVGKTILIDDGELAFKVISKDNEQLNCLILNDGELGSRKSINLPGILISLPSLSEKDKKFIEFAVEQDVAFIAHSFVRTKEDVLAVQHILDKHKSNIKIIAKIENQEGVDNIDEILDYAYGAMIARGDLGIEIPAEEIPGIQKMLIKSCVSRRKPVIVATQMLYSMIENPRPTRAEVSDIATAIYEGTDAIMLSGETAYGLYPVESVKIMTKIAKHVEKNKKPFKKPSDKALHNKILGILAKAAVEATTELDIKCIVADSLTGGTIRNLASYRGKLPVFAFCYDKKLARELSLSYGVKTYFTSMRNSTDEFFNTLTSVLLKEGKILPQDLIAVVAGNFGPGQGASFIEISTIESLASRAAKQTP